MPSDLSRERAELEIAAVNQAIKEGYSARPVPGSNIVQGAVAVAAERLGENRRSFYGRLGRPGKPGTWRTLHGLEPDWDAQPDRSTQEEPTPENQFAIPKKQLPLPSYATAGEPVVITSRPDNTFAFGAAGDLHAGSKYCRWDVRAELYRRFTEEGVQCNFDTGNWIDGEARFNTYDLEVSGMHAQCEYLAKNHPKGLRTYAVWGDDHEGWYAQREGVDMGMYSESVMRRAGHDWTNIGFMEAHVILRNADSGMDAVLAVVHPGGGSAYALSYSIQKIIESLEGGEKPSAGFYGHYHKIWTGNIRNVWAVQTACQQDQTPFMRKKKLEAHVGGVLVKFRQDPETGALTSMTTEMMRFFNKGYYAGTGRWSKHGPVTQLQRVS
jgi:hypothetical protein